jgi:glycosyltransferase involved in cell wall biosynthesis
MKLVFADNAMEWNGDTPDNRPLGGSQSACIYLSRVLASHGHEMIIYNYTDGEPGMYSGVEYRHIKNMETDDNSDVDVFMSIRDPRLYQIWNGTGIRILKIQDDFNQPLPELLTNPAIRVNNHHYLFVSKWQMKRLITTFQLPERLCLVHPNGFWKPNFPLEFSVPTGNKLAYCSTPFRGLEELLDLFPEIRRQVPDAELHVFSDMKIYQYTDEKDQERCGHIYAKLEQPGVVNHGSVGQQQLAHELTKCKILAYPNKFPETSCIAAMEAQAAGCVVVTSDLGALPETVGPHGAFISGKPGDESYNKHFINKCVKLLHRADLWEMQARKAHKWIQGNTWGRVAEQYEDMVETLMRGRSKVWTVNLD